jgi:hypothetical protein
VAELAATTNQGSLAEKPFSRWGRAEAKLKAKRLYRGSRTTTAMVAVSIAIIQFQFLGDI